MPRHTVRLLATIGACSAFALALSNGASALDLEVNTPHINVPPPRVNVPKPHINVPTVNLPHRRLSTGANTLKNVNKLGGSQGNGTTTAKTPFVGPSDTGGSAEGKVITETVGGSGTPAQIQQQNAAAVAIGAASNGTSPADTLPASVGPNRDSGVNLGLNATQVVKINPGSIAPPYGTAAYYNYLTAGGKNVAYAADMSALEAAACPGDTNYGSLYNCVSQANPSAAVTALVDFQAEINYLLFLLGLTQATDYAGYSFTPQETALIEQAITQCLASPSTCAATIANLETELQSLGVPASIPINNPGTVGTIQVYYTPAQIVGSSLFSIQAPATVASGAALSAQVANAGQVVAAAP